MKKAKARVTKSLPTDFSTVEESKIEPSITTTDETKEIISSDQAPPPVPEIDQDAELKIDEAQMQPEELPQQEKHGKSLFVLGSTIAVVILAGVIALSFFYLKSSEQKTSTVQPTLTPTAIISETSKPELIKANFNFEILNASGVSGLAGKTKIAIEDLGYTVSSIGNANSRETGTKVLLKANLVTQKDLLISDLQSSFPGLVYGGEFDSETATVRIILGE